MKKIGKLLCPNHEMSYICSIFVFLQKVCEVSDGGSMCYLKETEQTMNRNYHNSA